MDSQVMPLISISFSMSSDVADLDKISKTLNLTATRTRKKYEWPQISIDMGFACDEWVMASPKITSFSVDEECKKVIDILREKENHILALCEEFKMQTHFEVLVHMKYTASPAIFLDRDTIAFLARINASIGFDIYNYDEEEDEL